MPQATDEQRALMAEWFGDDIGCEAPSAFLQSRGYALTDGWAWVKPVPSHRISEEEKQCLWFLIDEWDYGGVESPAG